MTVVMVTVALTLPQISQAGWGDVRACLSEHVLEAIALNKQRKPVYMQLSQGRSQSVSDAMLRMENWLLLTTPFADAWAVPFQAKGIPVLCEDFVSMLLVPAFKAQNPEGPDSLYNFQQPDIEIIKDRLLTLYKAKSYIDIAEYADWLVQRLDQAPRYNCLVKHMLESIHRIATLTPVHARNAQESGMLISPEPLSRAILKSHILLLDESAKIDALAAPLQAEGLPIVCQDVPSIR